jgi:hypothetical protein
VPELYQLALDKYNAEGDQMAQKLGVLTQDRQMEYGEWGDKYNRLVADRDYLSNEYNNAYNRDYSTWNDNRSYDTSQYWNEHNTGYQADRDAIADAQWQKQFDAEQAWKQKEFDEALRQYNEQLALQKQQLAASRASSGSGNRSKSPKTPTAEMFEEALSAFNSGGRNALEQYVDKYPEYDYEQMMEYATNYGGKKSTTKQYVRYGKNIM